MAEKRGSKNFKMKKAKSIIAEAIKAEIGEAVKDVEYSLSKSSVLMRIWKDEWYVVGHAFTESGNRICFYSGAGIRQILRGCSARWSQADMAIQIHIS